MSNPPLKLWKSLAIYASQVVAMILVFYALQLLFYPDRRMPFWTLAAILAGAATLAYIPALISRYRLAKKRD